MAVESLRRTTIDGHLLGGLEGVMVVRFMDEGVPANSH